MSDIKFKKLSLRNFLSFGNVNVEIILNRNNAVGVTGEDLDNTTDGKRANGVGKTVLLNAIAYVLYDKTISDISKDNLINNINKKNMLVSIWFTKDGKKYQIERGRKVKGKGTTHVAIFDSTGKDIAPANGAESNEKIAALIGLPFAMFKRIVLFTASDIPFFALPVRDARKEETQMAFIEELFGLKLLSNKAKLLAEERKETKRDLEQQLNLLSAKEEEIKRHESQIQSIKLKLSAFETNNQNNILGIETQLKSVEGVNIEREKQLYDSLVALQVELHELNQDGKLAKGKATSLDSKLARLEQQLTHLRDDKCPFCEQSMPNANEKISELEKDQTELQEQSDQWQDALKIAEEDTTTLLHTISDIQKEQTVSDLSSLLDVQAQQTSLEDKLTQLKETKNPYTEILTELNDVDLEKPDYTQINDLKEQVEHQDFLYKLLTKKDSFVRKTLLDKNIPFLNKRLTKHLVDLGLPHKITFTHEMTAKIEYFGRELNFGNLSSGQRARLNLALSLSFRDVLQALHGTINLCFFDEVLDVGLDSVGVQAAAKVLKKKGKDEGLSIFVISHKDELDGFFEDTLTIQMSQGFSIIRKD